MPGAELIDRYASMLKLMRLLQAGHHLDRLLDLPADEEEERDNGHLFMRMAMLFHIFGELTDADQLLAEALRQRQHYQLAADRQPATLRLLVLMRSGFLLDNTPVDFLVEGSGISCELLYIVDGATLPAVLPAHDAVFVAVGHFDRNRSLFDRMEPLLRLATGPVYNRARPEFSFERDRLSELLQDIAHTLVPLTRVISRGELGRLAARERGAYPLIVRPLRSQAGKDLARLDCAADLAAYLDRQSDAAFYLAPYIEYRGSDGLYRKCRLALIRGRPYVCHLAISSHWVVHYQSAGMEDCARKRSEEARFMEDFERGFGVRHAAALAEIARRIGFDYVVVDCGETADGQLLFFEADNVSIVHATDPAEIFPYKQAQMSKVFDAFRLMLESAPHA